MTDALRLEPLTAPLSRAEVRRYRRATAGEKTKSWARVGGFVGTLAVIVFLSFYLSDWNFSLVPWLAGALTLLFVLAWVLTQRASARRWRLRSLLARFAAANDLTLEVDVPLPPARSGPAPAAPPPASAAPGAAPTVLTHGTAPAVPSTPAATESPVAPATTTSPSAPAAPTVPATAAVPAAATAPAAPVAGAAPPPPPPVAPASPAEGAITAVLLRIRGTDARGQWEAGLCTCHERSDSGRTTSNVDRVYLLSDAATDAVLATGASNVPFRRESLGARTAIVFTDTAADLASAATWATIARLRTAAH